VEGNDSAIGKREDRNLAGDIRIDRAGDLKLAADGLSRCLDERKAAGTLDMNEVGAVDFLDLRGRRGFRGLGRFLLLTAGEAEREEKKRCGDSIQAGGT
jgi:hypothetical protein